jgi:hypothetical protein
MQRRFAMTTARSVALGMLLVGCGGGGDGGGSTGPTVLPPAAIVLQSGGDQVAEANAAFAQPIVVRVTNARGEGVSGATVTFALTAGTGTANPASVPTDAQGMAQTALTAGATPGRVTLTASVGGVASPATINLKVTVAFSQMAGAWDGTTSQNLPVYMRITPTGLIDSLTIRLRISLGIGTCSATYVTRNVQVSDSGTVEFPVTLPSLFSTRVRGTFTSSVAVAGTYDAITTGTVILCGNTVVFGSSGTTHPSGSWTGRKR